MTVFIVTTVAAEVTFYNNFFGKLVEFAEALPSFLFLVFLVVERILSTRQHIDGGTSTG